MREPRFHRSRDRAVVRAPRAKGGGPFVARGGHMAEHEIAAAGERLGVGRHDIVGPECQGLLEIRGRRRVVDGDQYSVGPSGLGEMPNVAHVELRVGPLHRGRRSEVIPTVSVDP